MAEFVLLKPHRHRRAMLLVTLYLCRGVWTASFLRVAGLPWILKRQLTTNPTSRNPVRSFVAKEALTIK